MSLVTSNADRKLWPKFFAMTAPMNHAGGPPQSSTTVLSSILSLYLLKDPPSPPSALPTVLRLIDERRPFLSITSNSQVLHKWNTRVSSLIQSKSAESRYWGICLAKATISNGGEGVSHAVVWVKLLLAILNVHPLDFHANISDRREMFSWSGLL